MLVESKSDYMYACTYGRILGQLTSSLGRRSRVRCMYVTFICFTHITRAHFTSAHFTTHHTCSLRATSHVLTSRCTTHTRARYYALFFQARSGIRVARMVESTFCLTCKRAGALITCLWCDLWTRGRLPMDCHYNVRSNVFR
jgi:hypothetical protein